MKVWKKRDNDICSIKEYFQKKHGTDFFDERKTYKLPNADKAAQLIKKFQKKLFFIIGDYDVDGIVASAILKIGLERFGCETMVRLPKRISEGYGISESIVDEVPKGAVVMTVDNGIAATTAIKTLKERGHTVIVTDHHLPPKEDDKTILPDADIIVDAHVYGEDFNGWCGAGVAYKIIQELIPKEDVVMPLLTAYAAIGTVADVMDLTGENHRIVKEGLEILNGKKGILTKGLKALLTVTGKEEITTTDIAFAIAPILNTPGRLEDDGAKRSFSLIIQNKDTQKAYEEALLLKEMNEERKELEKSAIKKAEEETEKEGKAPIITYLPETEEGILGLIASELVKKYKTPAFVLSDAKKEGILKGSGRSVDEIHLKNLLDKHKELFTSCGGHAAAAGLSLQKENLPKMKEAFFKELESFVPDYTEYYDLVLEGSAERAFEEISSYAPHGKGNEMPVFAVKLKPETYNLMGDSKQHIKIIGNGFHVLVFHRAEEITDKLDREFIFYGKLSKNKFRDTITYQIIADDFETL